MIKKTVKTLLACFVMLCTIIPSGGFIELVKGAELAATQYLIYPKPQDTTYEIGAYILKDINVIYDDAIDVYTKSRLLEVAAVKKLNVSVSTHAVLGKTNIYVGVYGSGDAADTYIQEKYAPSSSLFEELDSYFLKSDHDVISILGKDTDASFYGLTSLYHVFTQLESLSISNFTINDYADIAYRGFIEGYYGNPWSNEDRAELMKFGGYYKMNQYAFAPKDDPYHNSKWRDLYPETELDVIKNLAKVGSESKCRYVWTIHPFMNQAFNFNNYENDLHIIEAKFDQLIESGVRQFGLLADDAAGVSVENTNRLLSDLTTYLNNKKVEYPDLVTDIFYCPAEYYYGIDSLAKYKALGENVKVATTGGKIWGEVNNNYLENFTQNVGRKGYMWVNWPCTDNSKKHLIMGGYADFLQPGVNSDNIQGSILNPMQQSEPSKIGIFGNAAYSWNIWQTAEEADQAWSDSFAFVDHNSATQTEASNALRELSKHMINQAMDSRVRVLQESVELKEILNPVKDKLRDETYTSEDLDAVISEFVNLQDAAKIFREQGNKRLLGDLKDYTLANANEQMGPWIDCWDDTTTAALAYLQAINDYESGNMSSMLDNYTKAQEAFAASKSIELHYLDHMEKAEVGVQHIVPFINEMDSYLSRKVKEIADPNAITYKYISDVFTTPYAGNTENLFDQDDSTSIEFHNPNYIYKGNYVGTTFNRPIDVNSIRILSVGGKNHFFHTKLQYTLDKETWTDIPGATFERPANSEEAIDANNLKLKNVLGVRMIATANNGSDSWLTMKSFDINKESVSEINAYNIVNAELENCNVADGKHPLSAVYDGDINKETYLFKGAGFDMIPAEAAIIVDLGEEKEIGSVYFAQATSSSTDFINEGKVEYSRDKSEWKTLGSLTGKKEETVRGLATARYVRIRNTKEKPVWWRAAEIQVFPASEEDYQLSVSPIGIMIARHASINDAAKNNTFDYIVDGDKSTSAWMSSTNPDNGNLQNGNGFEISFGKAIDVKEITMLQDDGDKVTNLKFQYNDGTQWKDLTTVENAQAQVIVDGKGINANAIRILNNGEDSGKWWKVFDVNVSIAPKASKDNVFSNVDNSFSVLVTEQESSLSKGEITLAQDEYIGINLGSIQNIDAIALDFQAKTKAGFVLETSLNAKTWSMASTGAQTNKKAQYIRLRNDMMASTTYTLEELRVTLKTIGEYGELVSSDIAVTPGWGDARGNGYAFDSSMNTIEKFGGQPKKGNTAVFSFGQDIDVNSIRIYTQDTQSDFIRDAIIQLSSDNITWTDAFMIGDTTTDTFTSSFGQYADENKKADSNYPNVFYYGNDGLSQNARYLRILIAADYPSRALAINAIVLNNGEYISTETNAAFEGTQEAKGHLPSYMLDGNLTTTYKPALANGSITYDISKGDDIKAIRFIQSGSASEAVVTARVYNTVTKSEEDLTLGTMAQAINEFNIPSPYIMLSSTISWKDKLPNISEIITTNFADDPTNAKVELKDKIDAQPTAYATWTNDSKLAYDEILRLAKVVFESPKASGTTFLSMANSLQNTIDSATTKADQTKLDSMQKLIDEQISNEKKVYTAISYEAYANALGKVVNALMDKENIASTTADNLITLVESKKTSLAISTYNREIAELSISGFTTIVEENYSKLSYKNLKLLNDEIEGLITTDKAAISEADRIDPETFHAKVIAYNTAKENLLDISELNELLAISKTEALYTVDTWKAYIVAKTFAQDAVNSETATNEEINMVFEKLVKEEYALLLLSNVEVGAYIEELKLLKEVNYTDTSYKVLKDAMDKAVADLVANDNKVNLENIQKMTTAKNGLINVVALNTKLEEIAQLDKMSYTKDSILPLDNILEKAAQIKKDGSTQDVLTVVKELSDAVNALEFNAMQLDTYRSSISLENELKYTSASYAPYKLAYDVMMALKSGNTTVKTFQSTKDMLEKAIVNLEIQLANYTKVKDALSAIPTDLAFYTGDSVKVLLDLLKEIDYTLDSSKQKDVDAYEARLLKAISGLQLNAQDTPDDNPTIPENPDEEQLKNPQDNDVSQKTDGKETGAKGTTGALTGEIASTGNSVPYMLSLLPLIALVLLKIKKDKNHVDLQ